MDDYFRVSELSETTSILHGEIYSACGISKLISVLTEMEIAFTIERFGSLAAVLNNFPPLEIYHVSSEPLVAPPKHYQSVAV